MYNCIFLLVIWLGWSISISHLSTEVDCQNVIQNQMMRNCLIHSTTGCPFPTCSPYSAPRVSHRKHLQTLRNVPTFPEIKPYTRNSNPNSFILSCRDLDKPLDFRNVIKSSHSKTTFASVFTYFLKILEYLLHPVWRCFQWVSFKLVVILITTYFSSIVIFNFLFLLTM